MPVIVFVSPKGGAGKTTAALVLATQLARASAVTVVDADPNHPIEAWSKGGNLPSLMTVQSTDDEETIMELIEEASAKTPFVVVDLEGTAAKIVLLAASMADLVIVPTQGSQLDAEQAGRALRVMKQLEKMGRRVTQRVLFTRTAVLMRTRNMADIAKNLNSAGIPTLKTELHEREAFRAMFSFRQTLENLRPEEVSNIGKAVTNAEAFSREVVELLRSIKSEAAEPRAA